jgi:predicted nucleotidyltransferase
MLDLIEARQAELSDLCRKHHVRRLDVFGSAARGIDFDPARSDIDLLVTYLPGHGPGFGEYLELREGLEALLGRRVDLVMEDAVENPFIRADIERFRQPIYAA